jgi:hypothetical protein
VRSRSWFLQIARLWMAAEILKRRRVCQTSAPGSTQRSRSKLDLLRAFKDLEARHAQPGNGKIHPMPGTTRS